MQRALVACVRDIDKVPRDILYSVAGKDVRTGGTMVTLRVNDSQLESMKQDPNIISFQMSQPMHALQSHIQNLKK